MASMVYVAARIVVTSSTAEKEGLAMRSRAYRVTIGSKRVCNWYTHSTTSKIKKIYGRIYFIVIWSNAV